MSRSYRKPYATVTGCRSAADDKRVARRGVRRAQDHALRTFRGDDWDAFLIPARYEASFNNVYGWGRDGKQRLRRLDHNDFNPYCHACIWMRPEYVDEHPERLAHKVRWIEELKRK